MAVKAVFLDVVETLVNESSGLAEIARHCGIEPHVMWAGIGAIIERGEGHRQAFELLGFEAPNLDGNDVIPATEAGMVSVFVRRGAWGHLQWRLPDSNRAMIRVDSLSELPEALARV
jgi:FMN phosphatase YigB (HAD superfamily)